MMKTIAMSAALSAGALQVQDGAAAAGATQTAEASGELFVFLYRPGPAWREGAPMNEQGLLPHGQYIHALLKEGRVYAAGGFTDGDGGMALVRAADIAEARALISADPAVVSGIFVGDVEQWRLRFRGDAPLPQPSQK